MKAAKKLFVASAASLLMVGAHAESSKFYWGGELGFAQVKDQAGELASALIGSVGGAATVTQDSTVTAFKVLGGYRYTENLDLELAYFQSSTINYNFNGVSRTSVAYTGSVGQKFSGFEYAANLRPNVSSGWNDLYFRIGGHSSKIDVNTAINANAVSASAGKGYSGTGTVYGVGYDQKINASSKVRYSIMQYDKIGGESGGTVYSIGFVKDF